MNKYEAVEVHRVQNGWMVHPTRGWLETSPNGMWDERIWVFQADAALFKWLGEFGATVLSDREKK